MRLPVFVGRLLRRLRSRRLRKTVPVTAAGYVPAVLRATPYAQHMPRRVVRNAAVRLADELDRARIDRYDAGVAIRERDPLLVDVCERSGIPVTELLADDAAVGRAVVDLANWVLRGKP